MMNARKGPRSLEERPEHFLATAYYFDEESQR
jgi:hypothetical protein